jgi:hypothetical protein
MPYSPPAWRQSSCGVLELAQPRQPVTTVMLVLYGQRDEGESLQSGLSFGHPLAPPFRYAGNIRGELDGQCSRAPSEPLTMWSIMCCFWEQPFDEYRQQGPEQGK